MSGELQSEKPAFRPTLSKLRFALILVAAVCVVLFVSTLFLWIRNSQLRDSLALEKAKLVAELQKGIDRDKSEMSAQVSGIYIFRNPSAGQLPHKMDLRSNGSALLSQLYGSGKSEMELNRKTSSWSMNGSSVTVGGETFQIEGYDLIDAKGNRWLRVR